MRRCRRTSSCSIARLLFGTGPDGALGAEDGRARGGVDMLEERGRAVGRVVVVVKVLVYDGADLVVAAREQRPEDFDQCEQEDDTSSNSD